MSLKFVKQEPGHPKRSLARSLRQTQSKDLHFGRIIVGRNSD